MDLTPGYFYHIFNRGNNSQKVFFKRDNYLFFLRKMEQHLIPFSSIVAWCLMPNHFHWVIFVHHDTIVKWPSHHPSSSRATTMQKGGLPITSSDDYSNDKKQTINQSIGILLSSYTRAIQNQQEITGLLFQKRTKAKPLVNEIKIESAYWDTAFGTQIYISEGKSYLETCVEYVHQNPVYDGLVNKAEEWEFSSFRDYSGIRDGKLIDYKLISEEGLLPDVNTSRTIAMSDSNTEQNICIIGIGSNIEAEKNIKTMLGILKTKVEVLKVSAMLKTKPIGIIDQSDFTNGAVKIQTELSETELKQLLKSIEDEMGRDRTSPKFGPRCIDLDIVVWNSKIVDDDYYTRDFLQKTVQQVID